MFSNIYAGRRVLVTGHTGFKGSWLTAWLLQLGAEVAGYSISVPTTPANFDTLCLTERIQHNLGDVRDRKALQRVVQRFQPEIVFHLAAQALVRQSYDDPITTFETNTLGTLNLLECVRQQPSVRAAVIITSDKCYKNVEWKWGYRENDALGGEDPYSASKGCAELVANSYVHSYFKRSEILAAVATARAGNVIGGGDWADDRIVPDCIRSWSSGLSVRLRNPRATRPWQHVLEPLSGYLKLGAELFQRNATASGESYNFGPDAAVNHPVSTLIEQLSGYWPGARWEADTANVTDKPEAQLLKLTCDKALADLRWRPVLAFLETVQLTGDWYSAYYNNKEREMYPITMQQIATYCRYALERGIEWAR